MADADKEIKALELDMKQVTRTNSILNENQVQKIFNSTPKKYKYQRDARGGGKWTYVRASYVRRALDSIFGFNWSFDVDTSLAEAFEVAKITKTCVVKGVLTCRVKYDGQWVEIKKVQFGRAEVKFKTKMVNGKKESTSDPLDFGNDMKAATSDALKKCASMLGIAADIYDREEFMEIKIIGAADTGERDKNLDEMKQKAMKQLSTPGKAIKNDKS
jgi:hypothetical protein